MFFLSPRPSRAKNILLDVEYPSHPFSSLLAKSKDSQPVQICELMCFLTSPMSFNSPCPELKRVGRWRENENHRQEGKKSLSFSIPLIPPLPFFMTSFSLHLFLIFSFFHLSVLGLIHYFH